MLKPKQVIMLWRKVLNFLLICQSWLKTELYILRETVNCSLEVWLMPPFTPGEVGGHIIVHMFTEQSDGNFLLTKLKGHTGGYWHKVVEVLKP